MTRSLVGNAECWGQGLRAQAEGQLPGWLEPQGEGLCPSEFPS